jgi:hypothetical protein
MRTSRQRSSRPRQSARIWLTAVVLLSIPGAARAQYGDPELQPSTPPGENYHVEVSGTLWNPDLVGVISSEKFGLIGTNIDFIDDLGFTKTRFRDVRIVLRPSRKSRFRIQHTPVSYTAETSLNRDIVFNGQKFPVNLPLQSRFDWNVWRFGYEYDFIYRSRGFVGVLLEGRYTRMNAELASPLVTEFTKVRAPLPAIGLVGRAYVLPEVAVNFEVSMFRVPEGSIPDVEANYYDWDIHGTFNAHRSLGLQVGWRRMTNFLKIESDAGDVKFQGLWFGAALRY